MAASPIDRFFAAKRPLTCHASHASARERAWARRQCHALTPALSSLGLLRAARAVDTLHHQLRDGIGVDNDAVATTVALVEESYRALRAGLDHARKEAV